MRESDVVYATKWPVALALAAVAISSIHTAEALTGPVKSHIQGPARVLDGDTVEINGLRLRLEGIDAPETGQTCLKASSGTWDCGTSATNALEKLVSDQQVDCDPVGQDKYGRTLAICHAGGVELNEAMVRAGHAWAFRRYSERYVGAEGTARSAALGIWQKESEPAWAFREKRWASAETDAPSGCAIKGNVSRKGMLYHMPWSPWCGRVKVDPDKGERWFCTEKEALDAGFRPAAVN